MEPGQKARVKLTPRNPQLRQCILQITYVIVSGNNEAIGISTSYICYEINMFSLVTPWKLVCVLQAINHSTVAHITYTLSLLLMEERSTAAVIQNLYFGAFLSMNNLVHTVS